MKKDKKAAPERDTIKLCGVPPPRDGYKGKVLENRRLSSPPNRRAGAEPRIASEDFL